MTITSLTKRVALLLAGLAVATSAQAWPNYSIGHLADVTFVNNDVLITMDVANPTNCAGASTGWLRIPGDNCAISSNWAHPISWDWDHLIS